MKYRVTVTYRKGKDVRTHSFRADIIIPLCEGIRMTKDMSPKLDSVAWVDVISISVVPEVKL